MAGMRVALALLKIRDMRRVMAALTAFAITEHGSWLAVMVLAYRRGGVGETGVVLFAMLAPSGLLAPLAATRLARLGGRRALVGGFLAQATFMALTGLALELGANALITYAAALTASISLVLTRPATASLLPSMARTVQELTAANATVGLVATLGLFIGPALAGAVLATWSISGVFFSVAILMTAAAILTAGIAERPTDLDEAEDLVETMPNDPEEPAVSADSSSTRIVIALLSLVFFTVGVLDVAFVASAVELIGRSEATAGALSAAFGFGALAGAALSLGLVGRRRLTPAIALAGTTCGMSVVALSFGESLGVAIALLALAGAGRALADVAGRTMLQGLSSDDVLARVFGILEGISMFAIAFGALAFAALTEVFGLRAALVTSGTLLPAGIVVMLAPLMKIDRQRPTVDASLVSILRATPVFGPLPAYAVEQVLANLGHQEFVANEQILEIGEISHTIFFVMGGTATVMQPNDVDIELSTGDYFGEIALLFDRPRTATVVAGPSGASTLTIDRETYRQAIGTNRRSHHRVSHTARSRLERNGLAP